MCVCVYTYVHTHLLSLKTAPTKQELEQSYSNEAKQMRQLLTHFCDLFIYLFSAFEPVLDSWKPPGEVTLGKIFASIF